MQKFNLAHQYQLYLSRVNMSEADMNPIQAQETKRAFYGACGQIIILMTEEIPDVADKNEQAAIAHISDMIEEVKQFWMAEKMKLS